MPLQAFQQARLIQRGTRRAAPQQRLPRRADTPAVGVTAGQPRCQCLGGRPRGQFEQARHTRQLWLQAQLPGFVEQPRGITAAAKQQRQQVVTALPPPLLVGLQMALGQQHFGGHAHQFTVGPHVLRVAGQAQHAHQPAVEHQRQVDPRLHALQAFGRVSVQFDDPAVGKYQLGAFMAGVDAFRLAAAQDQPLAVHDIDVARQNGHRPVNDILCQVMVEFEHCTVLRVLGFWARAQQPAPGTVQKHKDRHAAVPETRQGERRHRRRGDNHNNRESDHGTQPSP